MKQFGILLSTLSLLLALPASAAAEAEAGSVAFADARVVYDYAVTDKGLVTLTLVALVDETNNSLRGLKNSDPRRLSKLGQLIYQCKLMLYRSDQPAGKDQAPDPFLISRNFSLFTGVDLPLGSGERIGVQALALREVDANSLFSASLGQSDSAQRVFESVADGEAVNLKQFDLGILQQSDLIDSSASIDLVVRFPVFQMEKPVSQWVYNFNLAGFKQAVRYADDNCTPARLAELLDHKT